MHFGGAKNDVPSYTDIWSSFFIFTFFFFLLMFFPMYIEGFSIELEWFLVAISNVLLMLFTISWVHSIENRHTGNKPTGDNEIFFEYFECIWKRRCETWRFSIPSSNYLLQASMHLKRKFRSLKMLMFVNEITIFFPYHWIQLKCIKCIKCKRNPSEPHI